MSSLSFLHVHDNEDKDGASNWHKTSSIISVGNVLNEPILSIMISFRTAVSESRFRLRVIGGIVLVAGSDLK